MSTDTALHARLHNRFQEVFGPPHHDLYETEQWSLVPSNGMGPVHVLLNGTPKGPLVWVFNPHDPHSGARHFAVTDERQIDELIGQLVGSVMGAPETSEPPAEHMEFLDDVLTIEQLAGRPSRPPNHAAENDALLALAQGMALEPQSILQRTVDIVLRLCGGHSSGINILELDLQSESQIFRWHATAGAFASLVGQTLPRESLFGTVLDRKALLIVDCPELHYFFPGPGNPPIQEVILAPFHAGGKPVGTVWVMSHTKERKFDREDVRRLTSVAQFAGAAYQLISALGAARLGRTEMTSDRDKLVIHRDDLEQIVAQRTQELVETHRQMHLGERMATLGTLSAGLGHDMANLVGAMRIRLDMLQKSAETNKQQVFVLDDCVTYLQNLASGLRLMTIDPDDVKLGPEAVALAAWWQAAHRVIGSGLTPGITIQSHMRDDLPDVLINRAGLTQAVYNLVQNAADAMKGKRGKITISAEPDESRSNVRLSVSDEGTGMTDDVLKHCMDPMFSTKTGATSSGLGLALVHAVMKAASGSIRIHTELGHGTTIMLTLPVVQPAEAAAQGTGH